MTQIDTGSEIQTSKITNLSHTEHPLTGFTSANYMVVKMIIDLRRKKLKQDKGVIRLGGSIKDLQKWSVALAYYQ